MLNSIDSPIEKSMGLFIFIICFRCQKVLIINEAFISVQNHYNIERNQEENCLIYILVKWEEL